MPTSSLNEWNRWLDDRAAQENEVGFSRLASVEEVHRALRVFYPQLSEPDLTSKLAVHIGLPLEVWRTDQKLSSLVEAERTLAKQQFGRAWTASGSH